MNYQSYMVQAGNGSYNDDHPKSRRVIVLQGVSGAGKSQYTRHLRREYDNRGLGRFFQVVSTDNYFVRLGNGTYKFDHTKLGAAHDECFREFLDLIKLPEGVLRIVVDNTNTLTADAAPFMRAASAFGWDAEIHRIVCNDLKVAFTRNTHGVPEAGVVKMAEQMKSQPIPDFWRVWDIYPPNES